MDMQIKDLDELADSLLGQAKANNFELLGPAEIEYGFGWDPTITFWSENRRVHFYFEFKRFQLGEDGITVELAEKNTNWQTKRTIIETVEEAWILVDKFLIRKCDKHQLEDFDWIIDNLDQDKFIPHPPNKSNAGNIAEIVSNMNQPWDRSKDNNE